MHLLYATDGSEASQAGAHLLAELPLSRDCRLTLLTVLPEEGDERAAAVLVAARKILANTRASLDTQIRWGSAAEEILRAVEMRPTDLVVMGSRGLSGLSHFLLGSVSERVARHAPCSVLLARPLRCDLRAAVLGVDGSECSVGAARWLENFPLPRGCHVHTVTVHSGHNAPATAAPAARPSSPEVAEIMTGEPALALLRAAERHDADLLVVGSHGRGGIGRLVMGSVSEHLLRHALCSVLVVKPERPPHR
jgi:nucleotide-binding universal stress UspA family protein